MSTTTLLKTVTGIGTITRKAGAGTPIPRVPFQVKIYQNQVGRYDLRGWVEIDAVESEDLVRFRVPLILEFEDGGGRLNFFIGQRSGDLTGSSRCTMAIGDESEFLRAQGFST